MTMKTQRTFDNFLVSLYIIMQDWLFHQLYYVKEDFADQIKSDELLEILQMRLNFESYIANFSTLLQNLKFVKYLRWNSPDLSDFVAKSSLSGNTLSHHFNFID